MKRIIFRNLKQRRAQVISMTVTIAVCSMVFVALFMLYAGMQRGVALNDERGGADIMVVPSEVSDYVTEKDYLFSGVPIMSYMQEDLAQQIAQIDGVERVSVQFYGQTLSESCCSTGKEARVIGFDPKTDWVISPFCDTDISNLGDNEIVIGSLVDGFPTGDGYILGQPVHFAGQLAETGSSLDYSIFMNLDTVRQITGAKEGFEHFWEEYGQPDTLVSTILVDVDDNAKGVLGKISKLGGVSVIKRSSVIGETQQMLSEVFGVMLFAGILLAVASILQFVARFSSSVWERKAELALYRAMGATKGHLRKLICGEAFVITGIGCAVGTVLGIVLYAFSYAYLQGAGAFPFSALPIWADILGIVVIIAVFFGIAALSLIHPLKQIEKIDPASAMQQVDIG